MSELLNNIDWNGAGLLFLRIVLTFVAFVSAFLGGASSIMWVTPSLRKESPEDIWKAALFYLMVSAAAISLLYGGLP
jgi:hypothetical protein